MTFGVDIEPTNRCNAKCYFCPRDQTPHQGLMSVDVFEQTLGRAVDLRARLRATDRPDPKVSLCGLGEPLLNRHTPSFVQRVREEGFDCTMSSNAAVLDEDRGRALIEAGPALRPPGFGGALMRNAFHARQRSRVISFM